VTADDRHQAHIFHRHLAAVTNVVLFNDRFHMTGPF
jgi:hypothetical protein